MAERGYEFRRRLEVVHQPDRRDPTVLAGDHEVAIGAGWSIVISEQAGALLYGVARDLEDYLLVSMGESVPLRRVKDVASGAQGEARVIVLATKAELPDLAAEVATPRGYRVHCTPTALIVCGDDERGAGQGSYYLEDLMNLREAPILPVGDVTRVPLFAPRMVHSGWGLDQFPDAHLNAMAHAGLDAILVFAEGVDRTPDERHIQGSQPGAGRYQDFRALVRRAAAHGLDVYLYSYLKSLKHPEEPGAEAYYDSTYGALFAACPDAKGVVLVGESVEFPSKDPRTTGVLRGTPTPDGLPPDKPSPGWWPCADYPQWLNLLKRVIRRHSPQADIVFWTYNWGYAPEADRLALIRSLPTDITLQVTFEMFEQRQHEGITNVCVDYTASFVGPGQYFSSEARVAHERGLRLYTMSNTGGLTWDVGVIPYEPIPYQWARRHAALLQARDEWGLSGLMESHHYGWWPSFVSELTKWDYWAPSPPPAETLAAIARRDFGAAGAPLALEAWQHWSEAITDYIPTNEDQYGPFRVGPSYPLVFRSGASLPAADYAMFGNRIVNTSYQPHDSGRQSLGVARFPVEIRSLQRMAERWQQGLDCLEQAIALAPEGKRSAGQTMLGLGRFILHAVYTTIHCKEWWLLKQRLFGEPDPSKAAAILDAMAALAEREIANAEATIPLVEADSRLGWEPSMEYMTDAAHLRWKIAQVRRVLDSEFPAYRQSLALTVPS